MLLFSLVSLVVFTVLMPFLTGIIPISVVPQLMSAQINHFLHGPPRQEFIIPDTPDSVTPVVNLQTTPTVDRIDLLQDFETLVQQNKQHVKQQVIDVYNQYVPSQVSEYLNTSFSYWQSHSSYRVYREHESFINNLLVFFVVLLFLKLIISGMQLVFGAGDDFDDELKEEENNRVIWDKEGHLKPQYTEFETIPLCQGKAEAEEDLIMSSYKKFKDSESKILQQLSQSAFSNGATPEFVDNGSFEYSIIDGSTPRQSTPDERTPPNIELGSPLTLKAEKYSKPLQHPRPQEPIKALLIQETSRTTTTTPSPTSGGTPHTGSGLSSSSSPRSISPEDSFEREERVLDKSLSRLNDQSSRPSSERPYTPSKLSISSSLEYSPSKKLIYKKSSAILTVNTVPLAETTVGSITEEIVYSGPFKIDTDTSSSDLLTPIRDKMTD